MTSPSRTRTGIKTNGAAIKALRERSGWGQLEFAVQIGISQTYLSNIEAGRKCGVRPPILRKMADTLGVSIAAITSVYHPEQVA